MVDRRAAYRVHACLALLCCIDSIIPTLSFTSAPQIFRPNVHSFCRSLLARLRMHAKRTQRAHVTCTDRNRPRAPLTFLQTAAAHLLCVPRGWCSNARPRAVQSRAGQVRVWAVCLMQAHLKLSLNYALTQLTLTPICPASFLQPSHRGC